MQMIHLLDLIIFLLLLGLIGKIFKDNIEAGAAVMLIYIVIYVWIFVFPIDLNWVDILDNVIITW